jgi:hypothetical protein
MKTLDTEFIHGVRKNNSNIAMKFGRVYMLSMGSCWLLSHLLGPFSVAASWRLNVSIELVLHRHQGFH